MDIKGAIIKFKEPILLVINLTILLLFINERINSRSLNSRIQILYSEIDNWKERYINFADNYPIEINRALLVLDIHGNHQNLDEILMKENHSIIFRYNEKSCKPCLFDEINTIKIGINNGYNIILLCNFNEYDDFITFCRVNKIKEAYLIRDGIFSINSCEVKHIPYYTKFNFNNYNGCFIPCKDYPDLTIKWFR
jgi:hypothetical protein